VDYKKIYDALIERGRNRVIEGYSESHHIVPRCMGGSDDADNLVRLTPEEHYVAHQLLVKMYPGNRKIAYAVLAMSMCGKGRRLYGWLRRRVSAAMSEHKKGKLGTNYGKIWINNGVEQKGIPRTDPIPEGWKKGVIGTKATFPPNSMWITNGIKKVRILKTDSIPEGWEIFRQFNPPVRPKRVKKYVTNGVKDAIIPANDPPPEGWREGRSYRNPKSAKGSRIISNGVEQRRIAKGELLPEGWLNISLRGFERAKKMLEKVEAFESGPKKFKPKTRSEITKENIVKYKALYLIYNEGGFAAVRGAGYNRSNSSLVEAFIRYVPEYVPRTGVSRKKKNGG
jgi:hypothetical protein